MAVWIALAAAFTALVAVFAPALVRASRQAERKKRVGGDSIVSAGDSGGYGKSKNDHDGDGSGNGDGGGDGGGGGD